MILAKKLILVNSKVLIKDLASYFGQNDKNLQLARI